MSKMKLKAPSASSLKATGLVGGAGVAGFLGSRAAHNFFPELGTPSTKNKVILALAVAGSLALHASVSGSSDTADIVRGAAAGMAIHNAGKLANMFGQEITAPATTQGANGLRMPAVGKAILCEHYPMRGLKGGGMRGGRLREIIDDVRYAPKGAFPEGKSLLGAQESYSAANNLL